MHKKICWVTPDWFVDVDMPIVPHLLNEYDITWIIFFPWRHNRFNEEDFKQIMDEHSELDVHFVHSKYYGLDPRSMMVWNRIGSIINFNRTDRIIFFVNEQDVNSCNNLVCRNGTLRK